MKTVVKVSVAITHSIYKRLTDFVYSLALVLRLYEYLCVMSTIPTLNPALGMNNMNSKSKTTLNSGDRGGYNTLGMKSNRGHVSPFKADK